ncbi:serpin family protein [Amycolatopsis minnesotensis]|uniref:Serpin family protein n=1 Tax=Amycolatopsis minnesotensis TaxID=337894 RepID=A0ABN2QFE5_9PSEU
MSHGTAASHLTFSLALHRAVATGAADSCFSPYSVASALGLVARAARGKAADELLALLGDDFDARPLREAATLEPRPDREEPVLAVANTLWVWDQLPIEPGYAGELATWPGGRVAEAPFVTEPERARQVINADIAETTRGLIPELLPPGIVGDDTVASVVNALYLRCPWAIPFSDGATGPAAFAAPSGVREVPTMHQSERLAYHADGGWQVVGMPAVGGAEAVVLLPDGELAGQEAALDAEALAALLDGLRPRQVNLALPKLDLDVRADLTGALQHLGVRTLFGPGADLSGLSPDPRLVVSDVLHQSVLRVDESGFEGAAATAAMMRLTSMPIDEVSVSVDRPFLLLVRHAATGVVYFFARVVEP